MPVPPLIPLSPGWFAALGASGSSAPAAPDTFNLKRLKLVSRSLECCPRRERHLHQVITLLNSLIRDNYLQEDGTNNWRPQPHIHVRTRNPGPHDDSTQGYGVGHRWYNTENDHEFVNIGNDPAGALWPGVPHLPSGDPALSSPGTSDLLGLPGAPITDSGGTSTEHVCTDLSGQFGPKALGTDFETCFDIRQASGFVAGFISRKATSATGFAESVEVRVENKYGQTDTLTYTTLTDSFHTSVNFGAAHNTSNLAVDLTSSATIRHPFTRVRVRVKNNNSAQVITQYELCWRFI